MQVARSGNLLAGICIVMIIQPFPMSSTSKQKAKERRSRQLDIMSDVENVDIMLGSYSREENEKKIRVKVN